MVLRLSGRSTDDLQLSLFMYLKIILIYNKIYYESVKSFTFLFI